MSRSVKYVIISPVRNEEKYISGTVESVAGQTVLPMEWVIVDDGSNDGTGGIIDRFADEYNWIHVLHRADRGCRKAGEGVMEAFRDGYASLRFKDWVFLVKLDGDLSFDPTYFEECFKRFEADPSLGIGGGMVWHWIAGRLELERQPLFHVRGATKIYRRECWEAIGGLIKATGWDTLDEAKANMLGWRTQSFDNLRIIHHRYTGAADGTWRNAVKNGRANYISGYHPLFMLLKCLKRLLKKPYLMESTGLLYGFLTGYLKRIPQIDDRDLVDFIRQQQMRKLLFRSSIWK